MKKESAKVKESTSVGNDANNALAVVYRLSNSDKEKVVKIPKNAKNITGNGIYLNYDLPIGKFGYMTHSKHLGYENADVVVLNYT